MKKLLISQAIFMPIIYFGFVIISALFASGYSHIGQHASELGINENSFAVFLFQIGIILTSSSLFLLSLGLIIIFKNRFIITSILVLAFGVTFIFGAIFPIGSPWHGLYGIGIFIMILPFVFLYELSGLEHKKAIKTISIIASFLMFIYLWLMIARLDPIEYRGLTQRIFGVVVFGWFSSVSFFLKKMIK